MALGEARVGGAWTVALWLVGEATAVATASLTCTCRGEVVCGGSISWWDTVVCSVVCGCVLSIDTWSNCFPGTIDLRDGGTFAICG